MKYRKIFLFVLLVLTSLCQFVVVQGIDKPEAMAEGESVCDEIKNMNETQLKKFCEDNGWKYDDWSPDMSECFVQEGPAPEVPFEAAAEAASGPEAKAFAGGCPCPGGVNIKVDGCNITATCGAGLATASIGCPEVRGADPQYPLVKMLSGILVEWNGSGASDSKITLDKGSVGVGSQHWMLDYSVTISSIDLGKESLFSTGKADHKTSKINKLDRNNFNFYFKGDNKHVKVLKPSEIYNAYKNKSDEVQAYLALAGKGFGERPWETYEKFIDAMCDMSRNKSRCIGDLSYKRHKNDGGMEGNVYMGNAQTTVIGVYSEYSSHPCHGATEVSDSGQPAFAIEIESTWCFNFHLRYQGFAYDVTENEFFKKCCKVPHYDHVPCVGDMGTTTCLIRNGCDEWVDLYKIVKEWVNIGGGESSGDCSACVTVKGYIGPDGKMHKDPYPISFYQSQALLMTP